MRIFRIALLTLVFAAQPAFAVLLLPGDILAPAGNKIVRIDPLTGAQTIVAAGGYLTLPVAVALEADGDLLVADVSALGAGAAIRIDPSTGEQTVVSSGGSFHAIQAIAVGPCGDIFVSNLDFIAGQLPPSESRIVRVDPVTGAQAVVSIGSYLHYLKGITVDPGGDLLVANTLWSGNLTGQVLRVDPDGGAQTIVVNGGTLFEPQGIAVEPGGTIVVTDIANDSIRRIDPDSGTMTTVSSDGALDYPQGIAVEAGGDLAVYDSAKIVRVDPVTGSQSIVSSGGSLSGGRLIAVVPTPGTNLPPVSNAGPDRQAECTSFVGASVILDGSGSADPDSTPCTQDDIVLFEWFEDFGSSTELPLGTGETLEISLGLGSHSITLRVTDEPGATDVDTAVVTVEDTTPPAVSALLDPAVLWPPNHRMVPVQVTAQDACSEVDVVLLEVSSSEPDDAPGSGDGKTVDDIQGASTGTADLNVELRAERAGSGDGRTYTLQYAAEDAAGNATTQPLTVVVPHDRGGLTDPLDLRLEESDLGTVIQWGAVTGAGGYNVIRGDLSKIKETGASYHLGPVVCIEQGALDETTLGREDASIPDPGEVFIYLVEYDDGVRSSYGTESAAKPRHAGGGDCS